MGFLFFTKQPYSILNSSQFISQEQGMQDSVKMKNKSADVSTCTACWNGDSLSQLSDMRNVTDISTMDELSLEGKTQDKDSF